jgi:hypothetical protein
MRWSFSVNYMQKKFKKKLLADLGFLVEASAWR